MARRPSVSAPEPDRSASDRGEPSSDRGEPFPEGLTHLYTLRDGHRVLVRPVQPSDRAQLAAGYAELSAAARRARFGSAPTELSDRQIDQLVDLDYDDRLAIGAVAVDEPGEPGVGVARYARC